MRKATAMSLLPESPCFNLLILTQFHLACVSLPTWICCLAYLVCHVWFVHSPNHWFISFNWSLCMWSLHQSAYSYVCVFHQFASSCVHALLICSLTGVYAHQFNPWLFTYSCFLVLLIQMCLSLPLHMFICSISLTIHISLCSVSFSI